MRQARRPTLPRTPFAGGLSHASGHIRRNLWVLGVLVWALTGSTGCDAEEDESGESDDDGPTKQLTTSGQSTSSTTGHGSSTTEESETTGEQSSSADTTGVDDSGGTSTATAGSETGETDTTSDTGVSDSGDDVDEESTGDTTLLGELRGTVMKGPFAVGSELSARPLDDVGQVTGDPTFATTKDALGGFHLEQVPVGPLLLTAEGYYYQEYAGELSTVPLRLHAVVALGEQETDARRNINLATHITQLRVQRLIAEGQTAGAAVTQADAELVAAIGLGPEGFDPGVASSQMQILGEDTPASRFLLALSLVAERTAALRAGRDHGYDAHFHELLHQLQQGFEANGTLPAELVDELLTVQGLLDVDATHEYWTAWLADRGVEADVPDLHAIVDSDLDGQVNADDNCPQVANPLQTDSDTDGQGDPCDGEWGAPLLMALEPGEDLEDPEYSEYPKIGSNDAGDLMVAWSSNIGAVEGTAYNTWFAVAQSGMNFTEPQLLPSASDSFVQSIIPSRHRGFDITWVQYGCGGACGPDVRWNRLGLPAATWIVGEHFVDTTEEEAERAVAAHDAAGNLVVAWIEGSSRGARVKTATLPPSGSAWGDVTEIDVAELEGYRSDLSLLATPSGDIAAAWSVRAADDSNTVYVARRENSVQSFGSATAIETTPDGSISYLKSAAGEGSQMHLTWVQFGLEGRILRTTRWLPESSSWAPITALQEASLTGVSHSYLTGGPSGEVWASWMTEHNELGTTTHRLWARHFVDADRGWSEAQLLADGLPSHHDFGRHLAMNSRGDVMIAWISREGERIPVEVGRARRFSHEAGAWGPSSEFWRADNRTETLQHLELAADGNAGFAAVWTVQRTWGERSKQIYVARYGGIGVAR